MFEQKKYINLGQPKAHLQIGSNRQFGLVFCIFFIVIALISYVKKGEVNIWLLLAASSIAFTTMFFSNLLSKPNYYWSLLGLYLGRITTPIILFFLFFGVFMPLSFILKILKKDLLNIEFAASKNSHWITSVSETDFTKQF